MRTRPWLSAGAPLQGLPNCVTPTRGITRPSTVIPPSLPCGVPGGLSPPPRPRRSFCLARATALLHRPYPGIGLLRTVCHTTRGLRCCVDVPDPGGMLLLNTDGCGVRSLRLSPGASLEGTGWVLCPAAQAVGPAVALPPSKVRPCPERSQGAGTPAHRARCRMVFRTEASCPFPSSPCTAMTEGLGR